MRSLVTTDSLPQSHPPATAMQTESVAPLLADAIGRLHEDRDAAARQAQDNDRLAPQVPQPGGKPPPRIITIGENHHDSSRQASPQPGRHRQGPWSPVPGCPRGAGTRSRNRDQRPYPLAGSRHLPGGQEVRTMPGLARREPRGEAADVFGRFDRMFEEWARMMPFSRWREAEELIRVEEFRDDGTLVIRADLPGIDPDSDLELTVSHGMLHIEAERRQEEKREEKDYVRRELRYGSLSRSLPLPAGATEADITATYKDGVLEIRIPEPKHEPAKKIAISKA